MRQLLIESILLSLGGAVLGLLFAQWNHRHDLSHMPADVAKFVAGWKTIRLDTNAFLFAIGISASERNFVGHRAFPAQFANECDRHAERRRARRDDRAADVTVCARALVVAEVTLALVLLVGAGLLVRSFQGLLNVNENYSPATLLTMNMSLPDTQYATRRQRLNFQEQVQRAHRDNSGNSGVSAGDACSLRGRRRNRHRDFTIEGRPLTRREDSRDAIVETASRELFPRDEYRATRRTLSDRLRRRGLRRRSR